MDQRNETTKKKAAQILRVMANPEFDLDAYMSSESFLHICENMADYANETDEMSEAVTAHWLAKGLVKELHDADRYGWKWASYVPVSASSAEDTGRLYPLIFILHGANNPIFLAETYGYTDIAAREEMIAIIPENESEESIDQLFVYAKEHYPVDWSRVYMVGYSLGGIMTSRHVLRWPKRFAGVGVGGMLFASQGIEDYIHQGITWPGEMLTEEMIEQASQAKIALCECMGENEFIDILPLTRQPRNIIGDAHPMDGEGGESNGTAAKGQIDPQALPLSSQIFLSQNKIASANNWRRIAGCSPITEEEVRQTVKTSQDETVQCIGFPFERTQIMEREGRKHYIGDFVNEEGESYVRFIGIEGSSHWPSPALAELTWEHIRHYARDPENGELIKL